MGKIRKRAVENRPLWPNAVPLRLRRNKLFLFYFLYSNEFSVQSIYADRYIHRWGLWVVSLECPFRMYYIVKKLFLSFIFSTELSRPNALWTFDWFPFFLFSFSAHLRNLSPLLFLKIILNIIKIGFLVLPLRMQECFWTFWYQFSAKVPSKILQIRFSSFFCIIFFDQTSLHLPSWAFVSFS